ncbi:MAG: hypothetical protein SPK65_06040, partial [Succinivibrio dextrinosolvens]|nr:hypothetical protein [Succinivibrio dextrinosolvens]
MTAEKRNTYKAQKRTDYKAPNFTATDIDLTFTLDDTKTIVKNVTRFKRLTSDAKAPLILNGEELKLNYLKVDGINYKFKETKNGVE